MNNENKNESKINQFFVNVFMWVAVLVGAAIMIGSLFLFFIFFICLFQGEFLYALYSLGGLAVGVGIIVTTVLMIRRSGKKRKAAERAANITEHTVDCGRFGQLVFEYDKRYKSDVLQGGLFPIFSGNEHAKLVFCAMDADGRLAEKVIERLEADRDIILEKMIRGYERYCEKNEYYVSGEETSLYESLALGEVSIEEGGKTVCCEFDLPGELEIWITVEFSPDKSGEYSVDVTD